MLNKNVASLHNHLLPAERSDSGGVQAPQANVLDHDALQRLRSLDPTGKNKVVERVVGAFEASVARLLPQLHNARGEVDPDGIKHVVHTLKSSSANVGAMKLSKMCVEIETMILNDQDESMDAMVGALSVEAATSLAALKRMLDDNSL